MWTLLVDLKKGLDFGLGTVWSVKVYKLTKSPLKSS